jgi:hypothetical protein
MTREREGYWARGLKQARTTEDLRNQLLRMGEDLKAGKLTVAEANRLHRAAGKLLEPLKRRLRGE